MPEIEGQNFPPYEFHEYPKALYPQGQALDGDGNARRPVIANDAEHEAELKAEHSDLDLAPITPAEGDIVEQLGGDPNAGDEGVAVQPGSGEPEAGDPNAASEQSGGAAEASAGAGDQPSAAE